MADTVEPSASWVAPDDIRLPLLAARAALEDAEESLVNLLAACLRARIVTATPSQRLDMLNGLCVQFEAQGDTATAASLRAAWADCEHAYASVVRAEYAYSAGLPPDIGLTVVVSPSPLPILEDESPC